MAATTINVSFKFPFFILSTFFTQKTFYLRAQFGRKEGRDGESWWEPTPPDSLISDQHSSVSRACQSACQEGCHFVYYCHRHRLNIFRTSFLLLGLVERKLASCSTPPLPFLSSRHSCSYNDLINSYTLERSSDTQFSRLFWKTVHFFFFIKNKLKW